MRSTPAEIQNSQHSPRPSVRELKTIAKTSDNETMRIRFGLHLALALLFTSLEVKAQFFYPFMMPPTMPVAPNFSMMGFWNMPMFPMGPYGWAEPERRRRRRYSYRERDTERTERLDPYVDRDRPSLEEVFRADPPESRPARFPGRRDEPAPVASPSPSPSPTPRPSPTPDPRAELEAQPPCIACGQPEVVPPRPRGPLEDIARMAGRGPTGNPVSDAARRIFATLHQSCESLDRQIPAHESMRGYSLPAEIPESQKHHHPATRFFNVGEVRASHPYLQSQYAPGCQDMRQAPPVFHVGGKADIQRQNGRVQVDIFNARRNRTGGQLTTLDCSGYLSATFAAAGLRLRSTDDTRTAYQLSAAEYTNLGRRSGDCMNVVSFTANQSIRAGDVFAKHNPGDAYGHSLIIESVGPDPFGLSRITDVRQCSRDLDPAQFDFNVIQSSSHAGYPALNRMTARDLLARSRVREQGSFGAQLFEMAIIACQAKFGRAREAMRMTPDGSRRQIAIVRHVGDSVPGCRESEPGIVQGETCVQDCTHGRTR